MLVWEGGRKQQPVAYDLGVWEHALLETFGTLSY